MLAAPVAEFDPSFPGLFAGDPPAEFVPLLTELAASVRPASLGACLDVMAEADLRDVLPTIDVPALLVWGELDVRSPLSVAREFEAAIPDATLVVIPGAGHVSHLEAPDRFNSAVREFCRAHLPRTLGGLVSQAVELPGGELRVLQPAESADLPDSGPVKWAPIAPYWSVLWRSGVALAQELDTIDLRGRRVVELGCGLGLPSLVAARGGADVLATDASPEALVLLERNAELNGLEIETATVDWGEPDELVERGPFDLVLAADVLYEPASIDALIELMPRLAPVAWLADPGRLEVVAFLELAGHSWPIETLDRGLVLLHRLELAGNQRQGDLRIK
jgi:2-polyprenyl-3-methyl-5-hydroxy-6-metoxy-1,4-benzoquinol methylase